MSSRTKPIGNISAIESIEDVKKVLQSFLDYLAREQKTTTDTADSAETLSATKANTSDVSTALANKSDIGHTHDARYYTESEIDSALSGKANTSHTHTVSQITNYVVPGIFIWAEESSSLSPSTSSGRQWSFGDGVANANAEGVMILANCTLIAIGLHVTTGVGVGEDVTVEIYKNGASTGDFLTLTGPTNDGYVNTGLSTTFSVGDRLQFVTTSVTGTVGGPAVVSCQLNLT